MYELVGEMVDIVCKLITVSEIIMQLPDIPEHKHTNLKSAKEGLCNVISSLADSAQHLGAELPSGVTEEDEKSSLLFSTTGALKAVADYVAVVKACLTRLGTINICLLTFCTPPKWICQGYTCGRNVENIQRRSCNDGME